MKKFTCREIMNNEGGCDMEFGGSDMMSVVGACGQHIMSSVDEIHKTMREKMANQMANGTEEDKIKWFEWFKGEWEKKAEV